ncbi:hypothetical protein [Enterococcus faecalis]|uniref:hypothetical protein n=1 Tax=Enterococcus faecalis TaxID=1351 RepID=UPI003BB957FD
MKQSLVGLCEVTKLLELNDYTLKINNKLLLEHTKVSFRKGVINHILGKNGVGKSQFAKDLLLNRSGFELATLFCTKIIRSPFFSNRYFY